MGTDGALATLPRALAKAAAVGQASEAPELARAIQRPLFQDRPAPNVIPFETYAPTAPRPRRTEQPRQDPNRARRPKTRVSESQASLDFLPAIPDQPRTLGTTVEAVIICEAPVATPIHRAIAAALDWSLVLIGYGLFLLAYRLVGGQFVGGKSSLIMFAAALFLLAFTYGFFWAFVGTETAGMRWARLKLLTFEGFPPEPGQRLLRFGGSCLSIGTIVGLLWSLADEESLAWQDHISRTFPTPVASESQILCRR
ncbi:MAG: RDD family protein [Acidobacteriia bacterium]|nr:RDD family protein [Terriglobia bacterium]MBV8905157.1 RDD family protein [Terriglobia bacterium]MBV9744604.1 RDD family protein [Terriglobia bacterium]